MRTHKRLTPLVETAEQERRCFFVSDNADRLAVYRRVARDELVAAHLNLYARVEYWNALNPTERILHIIRGMALRRSERVFAGSSAAVVFGWELPWSLLRRGDIYIAVTKSRCPRQKYERLQCVCMTSLGAHTVRRSLDGVPHGVLVTSPARTLVDCGLLYSFKEALPIFDSALRAQAVTRDEIVAVCDDLQFDCGGVFRLLHYADPASENGGESLCRAAIIELGFALPRLQHTFVDPANVYDKARADFVWFLPDGRIVVLEYDGMRKYVDPAMTNRRDVAQVVQSQMRRDELLKRAGVSEIIHVTYDDVVEGKPLAAKLDRAGIPDLQRLPLYDRVNY